ncbi:MAG TPA: GNAT family N-acetyltransferase [Acidimicrobiia bacterium]|nr:GNAT family N-acetyltransferase [Acidimicrobiia bacterium]
MNIVRISPPRLRTKEQEDNRSATWLELFYDLAFVVAVAAVSDRLLGDLTPGRVASYLAYFALLWWLWASHTYYADRYDTDDLVYRLLAAGQMFAVVVLAAALGGDTISTFVFALGYAIARALLVAMYWRAHRHVEETRALVRGYLIGFGIAAAVWTLAIFVPEQVRFGLWALALAIDLTTPWIMRREQAKVPLDVSHLPERFGLFTILVLGQSITAVVAGLGLTSWTGVSVVASAASIGVATGLWWLYFDNARGHIVRRDPSVRRTWRPTVWIYTHLPLAAGLATTAVSLERAIAHSGASSMFASDRWFLVGSGCVVLASLALIEFASSGGVGRMRSRGLILNRLIGIPGLIVFGLLADPSPGWIVLGVLGITASQLIGDMVIASHEQDAEQKRNGMGQEDVRIWDDTDNNRYRIEVDGKPAGMAVYHLRGGMHIFVHTVVDKEFSGRGLGTKLVKYALDDVKQNGGRILPLCPLFAAYIKRHSEYDDLVDQQMLARIDRGHS